MKVMTKLRAGLAAAALAASAFAGHAEEVTLRAITFTPSQVIYAQHFQTFVDMVNERGEGVVQIQIIGGPEAIPSLRQGEAQQNGVADIFNLPAGLYLNMVPEGEAFSGSNHTPMENRASGALDYINEIYHEKANAHIIAHVDGGNGFHLFLTKKPEMTPEGTVDLSEFRVRTAPLQRAFVENLGAINVTQSPEEVYTSLERGIVDGTAYTIVGMRDFNWHKFVKYRIDPGFFQTDVLISLNLDSWNGLSDEAKAILNEVGAEYEQISYETMAEATAAEDKALRDSGIEVITLEGDAAQNYLKAAYATSWERLKSRDATHYDKLRELFFTPFE
ncbi:TRAP transporter substrate-binding protein DctP [Oceanicella sp. SM1341]|uniref:TRAP transporter substrate-binding protein DctP n=1 Tax=Oceanicella sp. SM1341 TaxID=1548889 RepID=UPI000E4C07E9|nr:TRAP transporter substrate-binding protein DctP [Oceanicella sp. SM1341]